MQVRFSKCTDIYKAANASVEFAFIWNTFITLLFIPFCIIKLAISLSTWRLQNVVAGKSSNSEV